MESALHSIASFVAVTDRLATAGQPSVKELTSVAAAGFRVVVNLGLHDDPSYSLPDEEGTVRSLGMRYVHIPVRFASPESEDLERFIAAMAQARDDKVFVHCRHNKRVPVFVALDRILRLHWSRADALAEMERVWKPDANWQRFIDNCLATHEG